VKIRRHPKRKTGSRKARFKFTSNEPGVRFECRAGRKFISCPARPVFRKVARGTHKLRVRAVDDAGNTSAVAVFKWKVTA
jgi:hypothetical protein